MRGGPALAPAPDSEDGLSRGEEARSVARGGGGPMGRGERGHQPIREQGEARGWGKDYLTFIYKTLFQICGFEMASLIIFSFLS